LKEQSASADQSAAPAASAVVQLTPTAAAPSPATGPTPAPLKAPEAAAPPTPAAAKAADVTQIVPAAAPAAKPAAEAPPNAQPAVAGPARVHKRHAGLFLSFVLLVIVPVIIVGSYLFGVARDQYASSIGFSVQREDNSSALSLLGGLSQITGSSSVDPIILYRYITSRDMILAVEKTVDLTQAFTRADDPFFTLPENPTIEDREKNWKRMVSVSVENGSGLIEIQVRAFDPKDAQAITTAIRDESDRMLNQLSATAQEDSTRYSRTELAKAADRLAKAQAGLTEFRTRTQIVDPATDFAGRMGLLNSMLAKQAEALIERDILKAGATFDGDPRLEQIELRIKVISERIEIERSRIGTADDGASAGYAELVSQYENLQLESEFAQRAYVAALATLDAAMTKAQRNSRYLAVYMPPTLSERSQYPQRTTWTLLMAGLFFLIWSIVALIFYSIRDRR